MRTSKPTANVMSPGAPGGQSLQRSIEVMVVVRRRIYRESLARALGEAEMIEVVGTAAHCLETASWPACRAGTVLLVDLADEDGLEASAHLRRTAPGALVVALGVRETTGDVIACAEAGIVGYVTRDGSLADVLRAISAAACGELACSPRIAGGLFRHIARLAGPPVGDVVALTAREAEILALIDVGLSNKEIAGRLVIEVATVKNHVHHILEKLNVRRRAEAAAHLRAGRARGPGFTVGPTAE